MAEIYVAVTEVANLRETTSSGIRQRELSLHIPDEPHVIDYDRGQSPWFWLERVAELRKKGYTSIASHENPLRTPSAGAISFFYDSNGGVRYVAMAQKDDEAPLDPGFRVPRNGFPQSQEEWFTMNHLYREAYEEGLILTRGYELVLPKDGVGESEITQRAALLESRTPLRIKGSVRVPIVFKDGLDTLKVYRGERMYPEYHGRGAVSWTPETGFNFIKAMEVQWPIEDLILVDAETKPNGELIGRDYCIIDLEQLQGKRFAEPVHEKVHRIKAGTEFLQQVQEFERDDLFLTDKVPRSLLCQYEYKGRPVYPIDWMDESYEFLSNPRVLKAFNRAFRFSQFEKQLKATK